MSDLIENSGFAQEIGKFINAYMKDESILSKGDYAIYTRLLDIEEQAKGMKHSSNKELLEFHATKYNISLSQARNDMRKAMELFNKIEILDPATILRLLLHQCEHFLNQCNLDKDTKNASKFLELKLKVVDLLINKTNLNPSDLLPNTYLFFTGEDAIKAMGIGKYDSAEVIQYIECLDIDKEDKKRLKMEARRNAGK